MIAYFAYKRSGKNRYLVMRWKKRNNGIPNLVKEVSVGTANVLAKTIEGNLSDLKIAAYSSGSTQCVLSIDHMIDVKGIIGCIVDHHDRGYYSKSNIDLLDERKYIGALKQSDHHDIMKLEVEYDSYIEIRKNVYGKEHRMILYHSSSLEKKKK